MIFSKLFPHTIQDSLIITEIVLAGFQSQAVSALKFLAESSLCFS